MATLRVSEDGGVTWTNVVDNGPLDQMTDVGQIYYHPDSRNVIIGTSHHMPITQQLLDLNVFVSRPKSVIIEFSDTDFEPFTGYFSSGIGGTSSSTTATNRFETYMDTKNNLFSGTNLMDFVGVEAFGGSTISPVFRVGSHSFTVEARIQGGTTTGFDLSVYPIPPSAPVLLSPTISESGVNLSFQTQSGFSYDLEYKTSLNDSQWTVLQTVSGNDNLATLVDTLPNSQARLYRVNGR